MWLIRLVTRFFLPIILILLFSLLCIMFIWNNNSFTANPFSNVRETWFNIDPNGYALTPNGVLGKAVCHDIDNIYTIYGNYNQLVLAANEAQGLANNQVSQIPAELSSLPVASGLPSDVLGWFKGDFIKMGAVIFLMPIGVSLLFGLACMTVISILWKVLWFVIKRTKSPKAAA